MFRTIAMKRGALALLLASTVAGAAEAQPPSFPPSGYCTGGLSTLPEGTTRFHIALDDNSSEPGIVVLMRFINQAGTVVKTKTVNIGPGESATLEYRVPGLIRAQAEVYESPRDSYPSGRRAVRASQEWEFILVDPITKEMKRLVGPGPLAIPCWTLEKQ